MVDAAVGDLQRLNVRHRPVVRAILKKLLMLEENPHAGTALGKALVGFRKLVVGDRDWRIVWRVVGSGDEQVVEVAEVWAAGARSDGAVYEEVVRRLDNLPDSPRTRTLREVAELLKVDVPSLPPQPGETPGWLIDQLTYTVGMPPDEVLAMDPEEARKHWERYISGS